MIISVVLAGALVCAGSEPRPGVSVGIRGLEEIAWAEGEPARDLEYTGLTAQQRTALRRELQSMIEETFRVGGVPVVSGDAACDRPEFILRVSTSPARRSGEFIVEVDAHLFEPATLVRRPDERGQVSTWSGVRHTVVTRREIEGEIRFHARRWAEYFTHNEAKRVRP